MSKEFSIISQNLNGKLTEKTVKRYEQREKADIYAFQELKQERYNITDTKAVNMPMKDILQAEQIWMDAFPWLEFKSGYWKESSIEFSKKEIRIINFHSSPFYSAQMRYILLKRLGEIKADFVILLGDFNAEFENQTEQPLSRVTKENDAFLAQIGGLGFTELLSEQEREENKPHYTFQYGKYKKKLDHIFISQGLSDLSHQGWRFSIQYIDDVNISFSPSESEQAFTDHSGIKLTIQVHL